MLLIHPVARTGGGGILELININRMVETVSEYISDIIGSRY